MKGRKIDIHSINTGEKIMFKSPGKDYLGANDSKTDQKEYVI